MQKKPIHAGQIDLQPKILPWIGNEYRRRLEADICGNSVNGIMRRYHILGEAHYCRPNDLDGYRDGPETTRTVVRDWAMERSSGSAFFTRVAAIASGVAPDEINRHKEWHELAFSEFVQNVIVGKPRTAPSADHWTDARRRFFGALAMTLPYVLVVLGDRQWRQLPSDVGAAVPPIEFTNSALVDDAWCYPFWAGDRLHLTIAVKVVHPSAGYGNWNLPTAQQRARTCMLMYSNVVGYMEESYVGVGDRPFWTNPSTTDMMGALASFRPQ